MNKLEDLRCSIDKIDEKLIKLFEERMNVVLDVAKYKKENNIPVLNSKREQQVLDKIGRCLNDPKYKKFAEEFMKSIMNISKDMESSFIENKQKLKVGFQGVCGSFSEQALFEYFGDNVEAVNVEEFEDVFINLKENKFEYGVVPIENSSTGAITEVYDLLNKYDLYIVGECYVKVDQNLMAKKETSIDDIEEVYSHPQGFKQSRVFLNKHPEWKLIPYYNTAKSAEFVNECSRKNVAAIGSRKAAEIYGLKILNANINSVKTNTTRFIIVGRKLEVNKKCSKVSLVLSIRHEAGSLYNSLRFFAENNINLLKIESRPIKDRPFEYFFYIDFEGNINDEKIKNAIGLVGKNSLYLKIIGNYEGKGVHK